MASSTSKPIQTLPSRPEEDPVWLEEGILHQEQLLKGLLKRREDVLTAAKNAKSKIRQHGDQLKVLTAKKLQLISTLNKHEKIRGELLRSIQSTRDQLVTRQRKQQQQDESSRRVMIDHDDDRRAAVDRLELVPISKETQDQEVLSSLNAATEPKDHNSKIADDEGGVESDLTAVPIPKQKGIGHLKRIMEVYTLDTLALDELIDDASHRLMALQASCLAFGLTSKTWDRQLYEGRTSAIDPSIALCPYEMSGECADPYCQFQHLRPRNVKQLPYEMMRLPDIGLRRQTETFDSDGKEQDRESSTTSDLEPVAKKARMEPIVTMHVQDQEAKDAADEMPHKAEIAAQESDTFGEDFVALPSVVMEEEDEETNQSLSAQTFWWSQTSIADVSLQSALDWIGGICRLHFKGGHLSGQSALYKVDKGCSDLLSITRILGRLLTGLAMALHSGRVDLAAALCEFSKALLTKDVGIKKAHRGVYGTTLKLFQVALSLSTRHGDRALSNHFFAQVTLLFTSQVLSVLHEVDKGESLDNIAFWCQTMLIMAHEVFSSVLEEKALSGLYIESIESFFRKFAVEHSATAKALLQVSEMLIAIYHSLQRGSSNDLSRSSWEESPEKIRLDAMVSSGNKASFASRNDATRKEKERTRHSIELLAHIISFIFKHNPQRDQLMAIRSAIEVSLRTWDVDLKSFSQIWLTPMFAILAILDIQERKYQEAQRRLEHWIATPYGRFSDLLWSQFISLRVLLPNARSWSLQSQANLLPRENRMEHTWIVDHLREIGVTPTHLESTGNSPLARSFKEAMNESINQDFPSTFTLDLDRPPPKETPDRTMEADSGLCQLPRMIFVFGENIRQLSLNKCGISKLSPTFGFWFPKLVSLELQSNGLSSFPSTLGSLAELETLDVSDNYLTELPRSIGNCKSLKILKANNNKISALPETITSLNLEVVCLRQNKISEYPGQIVLGLVRLRLLDLEGNPVQAQ